VLVALLVVSSSMAFTQTTYIHEEVPSNASCPNAIQICGTTQYTYEEGVEGCLWFYFTLQEEQLVHITVPGHKAHLVIPPPGPCECPETGGAALVVNEVLSAPFPGTPYLIAVEVSDHGILPITIEVHEGDLGDCPGEPCDGCLPSFSPLPNERYVASAWVKEDVPLGVTHYDNVKLRVEAPPGTVITEFTVPAGAPMVEGWQLIEGEFLMPATPAAFQLTLVCSSGTAYFDDVRVFPADGSMKCYVYDPQNLRFMAELDERHFATFYEYDYEGRLVRVKKETERGVKTLKETRLNAPHDLQP
jgi:hypothetical protein